MWPVVCLYEKYIYFHLGISLLLLLYPGMTLEKSFKTTISLTAFLMCFKGTKSIFHCLKNTKFHTVYIVFLYLPWYFKSLFESLIALVYISLKMKNGLNIFTHEMKTQNAALLRNTVLFLCHLTTAPVWKIILHYLWKQKLMNCTFKFT